MNTLLTIIAILVDIGIAIASNNHMAKNTTINNTYYVSTDLPLSVKGVNIAYFSFLIILIVSLYIKYNYFIDIGVFIIAIISTATLYIISIIQKCLTKTILIILSFAHIISYLAIYIAQIRTPHISSAFFPFFFSHTFELFGVAASLAVFILPIIYTTILKKPLKITWCLGMIFLACLALLLTTGGFSNLLNF